MIDRIRRFGFRLLYNELAFCYDWVSHAVSLGRWRSWQRCALRFLPPPESGLVLELAHGTGDTQIELIAAGYRTIALDLSPAMNRLAARKLTRHSLAPSLLRAEAARLPLPSASIAAVVCCFPTAFILCPRALSELKRVLTHDGCALIVLAGELRGGGGARTLIRALYRLAGGASAAFDSDSLRDLFDAPGLTAAPRVIAMEDAAVQVVILRKRIRQSNPNTDKTLESAGEP